MVSFFRSLRTVMINSCEPNWLLFTGCTFIKSEYSHLFVTSNVPGLYVVIPMEPMEKIRLYLKYEGRARDETMINT